MAPRTVSGEMFMQLSSSDDTNGLNPSETDLRRFRQLYGVTPNLCSAIWRRLAPHLPNGAVPMHLLWALRLLKHYCTEAMNADAVRCSEKTFRKWSWKLIRCISDLNVLSLHNRFTSNHFRNCYMSVDAPDVPIREPSPFRSRWYSYKLNHAGLRYEVAVSIFNGQIVWVNGPFRPGEMNDVQIFRQDLKQLILQKEKVVTDDGYPDQNCLRLEHVHTSEKNIFMRIRNRHETVNAMLKRLHVLTTPFRHGVEKNQLFFKAVANICQLIILYEEPLFSI